MKVMDSFKCGCGHRLGVRLERSVAREILSGTVPSMKQKPVGYSGRNLLNQNADAMEERIVKSDERVRDLGEVFTPATTVEEMLDMFPTAMWAVHPSATFLEPACGDGNFLITILTRKLAAVAKAYSNGKLPAGTSEEAAQVHALEALASIYAVDISVENIIGGTVGHEIGARERLLRAFTEWNLTILKKQLTERSLVLGAAQWIVEHNLIVGNMLPLDIAGNPTGRDSIPIIEYVFDPKSHGVTLYKTKLGDVIESIAAETALKLSLFGPVAPEILWTGKVFKIAGVKRVEAPKLKGPARNGTGRR
jgi:hypothetical protein